MRPPPVLVHPAAIDRRAVLRWGALATAGLATPALLSCSSSPPAGTAHGVTTLTRSFVSTARGGIRVTYEILLPPGHSKPQGLPLCLVLHGRGGDHRNAVTEVHLDRALATVTKAGAPPVALVSVDGGDHSYWHRRSGGDDPRRMLVDELLPKLAAAGLRTSRFALFGWSMGGYGALLLAELLGAARVSYVALDSPALWLQPGLSAPGAFDDADDFVRNDVFPRRARLAGIPVRVMCGQSDPFLAATKSFMAGVPDVVAADYPPGGHTGALWTATAAAQLMPLARALA